MRNKLVTVARETSSGEETFLLGRIALHNDKLYKIRKLLYEFHRLPAQLECGKLKVPVYYVDRSGNKLCYQCANNSVRDDECPISLQPCDYILYYTGPIVKCDCGRKIRSLYGSEES